VVGSTRKHSRDTERVNPDARREEPIAVALAAAFAPPLEALGFAPPVIADDSVRFNGAVVRFEAKYEPRDGELAVYVIPIGSDEGIQLLMYLRAIRSPAAVDLGDAVADSAEVALRQAAIYAAAIPDIASLLTGDPEEIERARSIRWWEVGGRR
jgi:hypothetical protein